MSDKSRISRWDFWGRHFYALGFSANRAELEAEAETLRSEGYTVFVFEHAPGIWCIEGKKSVTDEDASDDRLDPNTEAE